MIPSYELETERYSIWKRILIFILDGLMALLLFVGLFFTLGNFIQRSVAYDEVQILNVESTKVYEEMNLPYRIENQYGLVQIDQSKYLDIKVEGGMDVEKAVEEFQKDSSKANEKLAEISSYTDASASFYAKYVTIAVGIMFIPLFIFQFLIPLTTKKHNTLAMKIFKVTVVDSKSSVIINSMKILARFLIIYIVEFLFVYLLIQWIGIFFVVLVTFALISFTSNRSTIHDLILKTKIRSVERAYNE